MFCKRAMDLWPEQGQKRAVKKYLGDSCAALYIGTMLEELAGDKSEVGEEKHFCKMQHLKWRRIMSYMTVKKSNRH